MTPAPSLRPAVVPACWLFLAFLLFYGLTAGGGLTSTDAVFIFDLTRSMVEDGSIALDPALKPPDQGVDGRYYAQWGIGQSIYGIPFFIVGRAAENMIGAATLPPYALAKAAFAMSSALAAALCVALTFLLAWAMSGDGRGAATAAIGLGLATPLWPYSGFGFNAALAAALLVGATLLVWLGVRGGNDRALLAAGFVLGMGWATRHEVVLAVIPIGAWMLYEIGDRRLAVRRALWMAPGLMLFAGVLGTYNYVRFSNFWSAGHRPVFALEGLWGFLLSPGGSLFLYAPIVGLGLWGLRQVAADDKGAALLLAGLLGVFFLFYATMADWAGGRSYGPRYLVPLLPWLCVPLAAVARNWRGRPAQRWLWGLLVASFLIQVPGALVDYSKASEEYIRAGGPRGATGRMFTLDANSLALNTAAAGRLIPANLGYLTGLADPPPPGAADPAAPLSMQLSGSLDTWWMYAFHLGLIGRGVALLVLLSLSAAAAASLRQFWRGVGWLPESPC